MNMHSILVRPTSVAAVLASAVAILPRVASAQVSVSGGILTISAPASGLNSKIVAGPAPGVVQLLQVPGAPDGQLLSGIRSIRVMSGSAPDQIEFDITQNTPFDVYVDTGTGDSEIKVKWVVPPTPVPVNPRFDLRQGAGSKKVDFEFESLAETADLDWTVVGTGAGPGEAKGSVAFKQAGSRNTADLRFQTGTDSDKLDLIVDSMSDDLRLDVVSRGAELVTTQVLADDPGTRLDVLFDVIGTSRPNFVDFHMSSAIPDVWVDFLVDGGSQVDEVKLGMTQLVPGTIRSIVDVDTGLGADKIDVKYDGATSELVWSGLINGGAGNDEIKAYPEHDTTTSTILAGGDGQDLILAEIKGSLSSLGLEPLRLLGGTGNDHLLLKVDNGVFGTAPVLDGGAGTDSGSGPGRLLNIEIFP